MKTGIFIAVVLHVAFILFGGLIFNSHKEKQDSKPVMVDLTDTVSENKNQEKKPPEQEQPAEEKIEAKDEPPPDAAEIMRSLNPANAAPALEQMGLETIGNLLRGGGLGDESFGGGGGNLGSGGQVGGTGSAVKSSLRDSTEASFSMSEIDQKPRVLFQAAPVFPAELRGKNMDGSVVVIFIVAADGRVNNQRVESANHPAFEKPALEAIRQWKFEPGMRGGQKVSTRMRVTIRFQRS